VNNSETWTLRKEDIRRLEAFETWVWRRIMISFTQHAPKEQILGMVTESRSLLETLRKQQKGCIGHDSVLKKVTVVKEDFERKSLEDQE